MVAMATTAATNVPVRARLDEIIEAFGGDEWHGALGVGNGPAEEDALIESVESGKTWVLIEENVAGGFWLTAHARQEDAAEYHLGQEYSEDWEVVELVDLTTGATYQPVRTITWEPAGV
jgi:hypothetical protein